MTIQLSGLLWFDNDPQKDWRQKVREAAHRYQQKFWFTANLCHINPNTVGLAIGLKDEVFVEEVEGIQVYATSYTQPNHFWITKDTNTKDTKDTKEAKESPVTQLSLFGQREEHHAP